MGVLGLECLDLVLEFCDLLREFSAELDELVDIGVCGLEFIECLEFLLHRLGALCE